MRDAPSPAARCPRCGVDMRPDALPGLCPSCLLLQASEPLSDFSDAMTTLTPPNASRTLPGAAPGASLAPGQVFGPYRIVRPLGRGGMGDVYEAEQIEQGRRVALKVLSQRLSDPHDRARFLREGQLAASINHPHTVYIFGSEEIAGRPVIAMELLAGGTLKDRVREQGPLSPAEAVDAILQIIAGLDAAEAAGILHRDVKPANCFIDRDGTVKVGDFGLSISTAARDVTQLTRTGAFQGTPQFAAPEQLKGEPLDVRADIYSVGATLYYLLTGQLPFDDSDLMALLTRIATEVPRSPGALQPRVPRGLAAIVLRCLAKDRTARPANYAALDEALRPFGSGAATPATIGLRFLAGAIDWMILMLPVLPVNVALSFQRRPSDFPQWLVPTEAALRIAYYAILEGRWGASIGKRLVGLRITKADGQPPGMARAFGRAVIFETPIFLSALPALVVGQKRAFEFLTASPWLGPATGVVVYLLIGLLFSTARRRNGFAAVHDLVSRTRVVRRPERGVRAALDLRRDSAPPPGPRGERYGPYEAVRTLGFTDLGELWLGFDPSLRRHVWIHALPTGAAPVTPLIRSLSRPGRLRWLSGRRSPNESWDVYEALDGVPLVTLLDAPQPWHRVRIWLLDLAREIDAGLKDGSVAQLTIEQVWITREGYAKLLDFGAPGVAPGATKDDEDILARGQRFLASIALRALARLSGGESHATVWQSVGRLWRFLRTADGSSISDESGAPAAAREPLPLSASAMLETLACCGFAISSEMVTRLAALQRGSDRVGHGRRAGTIALCGVMPTMMALLILVISPVILRMLSPEVMTLSNALTRLSFLSRNAAVDKPRERAALEVYIAGRFRPMITDPQTWTTPATAGILAPQRALAERVVADHPDVSADDMAAATAVLGPFLRAQEHTQRDLNSGTIDWRIGLYLCAGGMMFTGAFGIVWAFVLRGGLLLSAGGIAVVTGDGKPVSRRRGLWRGLLAWALVPAGIWLGMHFGFAVGVGVGLLFLAGAAWALAHPTRGLQDRIAGTWLVPR